MKANKDLAKLTPVVEAYSEILRMREACGGNAECVQPHCNRS